MTLTLPAGEFDAFLFDCDGTLVDTTPLHHRAWRQSFERSGAVFDFTWDVFLSRAGMGLLETVEELNRQFGATLEPSKVVALQGELFRELIPQITPIAAVVQIAQAARGNKRLAVFGRRNRDRSPRAFSGRDLRLVRHYSVSRRYPAR